MVKFRVTFEVEGEYIGDDVPLDKDGLRRTIIGCLDESFTQGYSKERCADTKVSNLSIVKRG